MNKPLPRRLTGNPAKASRITSTRDPDCTEGVWLTRTFRATGDLDESGRTFRAVVATNTPVARRDSRGPFLEILDPAGLENEAEDDTPLLTDHRANARETVGRASAFTIDGSAVHATLRLGLADDIQPLFERVRDGTLRHVSAGYRVLEWREGRDEQGNRTKTATRWRILEISLTPIPADRNAVIKRSAEMPFDTPEDRDTFVEGIRSLAGLSEEWADGLPDDADEAAIRASARESMLKRNAPKIRVTRSHDDPAAIQTRAADALAFRMGGRADLPEASREFADMSLMDHARASLERAGVSVRGLSRDEVLTRAMTTGDFPQTVQNAAGLTVAQSYQVAQSAIRPLFRQRVLSDFKTATAIRLTDVGELEELTESGEITATSRGEEGETLRLSTFARRLDLSRRLIIDDSLNLFGDAAQALGAAAAATEARLMAELLTGSATLSDGIPLFHSSRGNVLTASAGEELDLLSEARRVMRTQRAPGGTAPIQATPKFVICGPEMETALEAVLATIQPTTVADVNPFGGRLTLLVEPRIEDATWFVAADPAQAAVFNLAHLAGQTGPTVQRQDAWNTMGTSYRCFMDTGVGFAGWRGIVKVA